jgi:hypothetical protein
MADRITSTDGAAFADQPARKRPIHRARARPLNRTGCVALDNATTPYARQSSDASRMIIMDIPRCMGIDHGSSRESDQSAQEIVPPLASFHIAGGFARTNNAGVL